MPHMTATEVPARARPANLSAARSTGSMRACSTLMEERLTCSDAIAAAKGDAEADQLRLRPARERR